MGKSRAAKKRHRDRAKPVSQLREIMEAGKLAFENIPPCDPQWYEMLENSFKTCDDKATTWPKTKFISGN